MSRNISPFYPNNHSYYLSNALPSGNGINSGTFSLAEPWQTFHLSHMQSPLIVAPTYGFAETWQTYPLTHLQPPLISTPVYANAVPAHQINYPTSTHSRIELAKTDERISGVHSIYKSFTQVEIESELIKFVKNDPARNFSEKIKVSYCGNGEKRKIEFSSYDKNSLTTVPSALLDRRGSEFTITQNTQNKISEIKKNQELTTLSKPIAGIRTEKEAFEEPIQSKASSKIPESEIEKFINLEEQLVKLKKSMTLLESILISTSQKTEILTKNQSTDRERFEELSKSVLRLEKVLSIHENQTSSIKTNLSPAVDSKKSSTLSESDLTKEQQGKTRLETPQNIISALELVERNSLLPNTSPLSPSIAKSALKLIENSH